MKYLLIALVLLIPTAIFAEEAQQSMTINDIRVLKISPQDQRAVIKTQDRELKILNVGDQVGNGTVTEIAVDRVVIEEKTDSGAVTIIISLENGKQTIQKISKAVEEPTASESVKIEQGN